MRSFESHNKRCDRLDTSSYRSPRPRASRRPTDSVTQLHPLNNGGAQRHETPSPLMWPSDMVLRRQGRGELIIRIPQPDPTRSACQEAEIRRNVMPFLAGTAGQDPRQCSPAPCRTINCRIKSRRRQLRFPTQSRICGCIRRRSNRVCGNISSSLRFFPVSHIASTE